MQILVGESPIIDDLRSRISRIARTSFTVLVEGESGVGKELVAREIHEQSPRARGPFVAVNCAALVETLVEAELFGIEERTATGVRGRRGKFELADHGTLFLDEVADLSPASQAKLLRVLQDLSVERVGGAGAYQVDTRVIAATNRTLHALVDAGRFRADLYYRLSGVEVLVPPLRARRDDIPLLVDHFLGIHDGPEVRRVEGSAVEAMMTYDWPGNVRQLSRVIERAVALAPGPSVGLRDLPPPVVREYRQALPDPDGLDDTLRAWSGRYVRLVLERCHGNKRQACDVLDISYHTLKSHLEYGRRARRTLAGPALAGHH
ncbi:MAG TPA: sigma-54 dependent transcriptional regulator [Planctomycetaceae bacterium]|nr:sigma-54 dependent transcriptional regulator [Planctomycetaceae bacterium]